MSAAINGRLVALLFLFWMPLFAFSQAGATTAPGATLRTEVRLVAVDVVVLDRLGAAVNGLKAGDFRLNEDGTLQKITSVEEHNSAKAKAPPVQGQTQTADSTIIVSNKPLNNPAVWSVLLVDLFNTSNQDQAAMRRQLQQFVKQLPADEPIALVAMTSQIKVLSSFQDGAAAISQILDKNGLLPRNSSPPADIYARGEELMIQPTADPAGPTPDILTNKARVDVERQANRAQTTLANFSAIAKWLNRYPGRKNVYWLTAGFPLQGQPFGVIGYTQMNPTGPPNHGSQAIPMQSSTDKELESARVAIYPIDARGVAPPDINGVTGADTAGDFLARGKLGDKSIDVTKDDQLKIAQHSEMLEIAKATGGVASFNNDIAKTLRGDFDQNQDYYTIFYTPSNDAWNGAYRKISVALEQPGSQLVYRQGYYAKDVQPEHIPTKEEFKQALAHDASVERGVLFSAKVNRSTDAANVEFAIDPQTIQYRTDPFGKLVADVDCAIVEYDSAGKLIQTSLIRLTSTVSPERLPALYADLVHAKQNISLKPGAASLVLGVRDQSTGRFGKLEVALPVIALANEAPPAPAGTATQPGATASTAMETPASAETDTEQSTAAATTPSVQLIRRSPEARESASRAARHIILNVVVTDASGKPVSGLQQQDFTLLDNKQPQKIASFQAVEGRTARAPVHVILMLDTLNNSFQNVAYERKAIEKYLGQNQGHLSYPVSIALLSDSGVDMGQSSRDGNVLIDELKKRRTPVHMIGSAEGFNGRSRQFQLSIRELHRLAINQEDIPGRVILVWVGPGWPLLDEAGVVQASTKDKSNYFDAIVDLSTGFREAQMTVDAISSPELWHETGLRRDYYKIYINGVQTAHQADSGNLALQVLAYQSGGSVMDGKDLAAEIAACVADSESYYVLSFDSTPAAKDAEYRALQVTVDKPGLSPRTTTAYYAQP